MTIATVSTAANANRPTVARGVAPKALRKGYGKAYPLHGTLRDVSEEVGAGGPRLTGTFSFTTRKGEDHEHRAFAEGGALGVVREAFKPGPIGLYVAFRTLEGERVARVIGLTLPKKEAVATTPVEAAPVETAIAVTAAATNDNGAPLPPDGPAAAAKPKARAPHKPKAVRAEPLAIAA